MALDFAERDIGQGEQLSRPDRKRLPVEKERWSIVMAECRKCSNMGKQSLGCEWGCELIERRSGYSP